MSKTSLILVSESKSSLSTQVSDEQIISMIAALIGASGHEGRSASENFWRGLAVSLDILGSLQHQKLKLVDQQEQHYLKSMSPRAKWEYINNHSDFICDLFRAMLSSSEQSEGLTKTLGLKFMNELEEMKCTHGRFVPGCAYKLHPYEDHLYIPVAEYHDYTLKSKKGEFLRIMSALGAKKLRLIEHRSSAQNGSFSVGLTEPTEHANISAGASASTSKNQSFAMTYETSEPPPVLPSRPSDLKWISGEPIWEQMIEARLTYGVSTFGASFSNASDFGLNANIVAQIEGIGFSSGGEYKSHEHFEQNYEVEFWPMSQYPNHRS